MSDENKKPEGEPSPAESDSATHEAEELTAAGEKAPGESINPSASNDTAGMVPADSPAKPGGATPEQQAKAAELQSADPNKQTTSEPSDPPAAERAETVAQQLQQTVGTEASPAGEGATAPATTESTQEGTDAPVASGNAPEGAASPASDAPVDPEREAKLKAAAEARAARAAARAAQEGAAAPDAEAGGTDDKEAKAKAAAEARAARAAARAGKTAEPDTPKEPSPKQPLLDRLVQIIKENVGEDAIEEAFINERDSHVPTVVVKNERWLETANVLKHHAELKLHYLRNVGGNDMETHLEVVYHMLSLDVKQDYCFKVKTSREAASVPSITPIWATGNWNEREIYDLLGIDFPGHPDLRRIMMPDDWVGFPLRKDYEPLDPEV